MGAFCCENGRLVGVVAPAQPFAHVEGHKRTRAHCFSAKAEGAYHELRFLIYEKHCKNIQY